MQFFRGSTNSTHSDPKKELCASSRHIEHQCNNHAALTLLHKHPSACIVQDKVVYKVEPEALGPFFAKHSHLWTHPDDYRGIEVKALTPGAGRKSVGHIKVLSERRSVNKSSGFFYYVGIKLGELVHRCIYAANGAQPSVMVLSHQVWIEETIKSRDMVLLHVSGYFKEDQKAGYGVMIRDVHLRPIKSRKIKKQDMELRLSLKSRIWSYENGLIRCMLGVIGKDLEGFVFVYCNTCV
ncbi:uncharacterized protein LOC113305636 [Papaver somniferum]|uniref:uncharacterized protein LOC113305636 n=1 Tax=Papaver somniferum TaxID=3469 RepID=UPI000E6F49B8|nr:uncharacterized protein LOC113305636 [Papaver somniferum]